MNDIESPEYVAGVLRLIELERLSAKKLKERAAPELYEALEALQDSMCLAKCGFDANGDVEHTETCQAARTALARARGEE